MRAQRIRAGFNVWGAGLAKIYCAVRLPPQAWLWGQFDTSELLRVLAGGAALYAIAAGAGLLIANFVGGSNQNSN